MHSSECYLDSIGEVSLLCAVLARNPSRLTLCLRCARALAANLSVPVRTETVTRHKIIRTKSVTLGQVMPQGTDISEGHHASCPYLGFGTKQRFSVTHTRFAPLRSVSPRDIDHRMPWS